MEMEALGWPLSWEVTGVFGAALVFDLVVLEAKAAAGFCCGGDLGTDVTCLAGSPPAFEVCLTGSGLLGRMLFALDAEQLTEDAALGPIDGDDVVAVTEFKAAPLVVGPLGTPFLTGTAMRRPLMPTGC